MFMRRGGGACRQAEREAGGGRGLQVEGSRRAGGLQVERLRAQRAQSLPVSCGRGLRLRLPVVALTDSISKVCRAPPVLSVTPSLSPAEEEEESEEEHSHKQGAH